MNKAEVQLALPGGITTVSPSAAAPLKVIPLLSGPPPFTAKFTSEYDGDAAYLVAQAARSINKNSVQTTKNNGRTNFFKLPTPLISNRCEKRGRGLGLTNKASSRLDASATFVRMLAPCKYFFSFKNKKVCFSGAGLSVLSYRQA